MSNKKMHRTNDKANAAPNNRENVVHNDTDITSKIKFSTEDAASGDSMIPSVVASAIRRIVVLIPLLLCVMVNGL